MSDLAPVLQAFFTDRLMTQRQASPHTISAYRDTFKLLLGFAGHATGKHPARLSISDLDAPMIGAFLQYLETARGNTVATRNARLAAIHSLFRYAALHGVEHAADIQRVLAIPHKRRDRAILCFLTREETDALLAAPDLSTWTGRRDHALLLLAVTTGLRVSELTGLRLQDVHLGAGQHVRCTGKGRKDRCTPLTGQTAEALRVWLAERGGHPDDPVLPSRRGGRLSSDAVQRLVATHAAAATGGRPSLQAKKVTPHTLRHTCAMSLLHAGVDISVIALWLGHESCDATMIYLHADLTLKQRALDRTLPPGNKPGRYRPPDTLLAFLDSL
jgi:site-specific recombinase XerD